MRISILRLREPVTLDGVAGSTVKAADGFQIEDVQGTGWVGVRRGQYRGVVPRESVLCADVDALPGEPPVSPVADVQSLDERRGKKDK